MSNSFNYFTDGSYSIISFIIALSIIVFIHEFGHYIVGRWCGIKAEVFSIGFGPIVVSVKDRYGTKWQIALLPLGGFVKFSRHDEISGDVKSKNVGFDHPDNTFDGASLVARTLTVLAGPIANFILTFLILLSFIMINGISSNKIIISKIVDYPFETQELRKNDKILSVNGLDAPSLSAFYSASNSSMFKKKVEYKIERDGRLITVIGPHPFPAVIGSVSLRSAASAVDLKAGDLILEVNGNDIFSFFQLQELVINISDYPIRLKVWRSGDIFEVSVTPKLVDYPDETGVYVKRKLIGITGGSFFELKKEKVPIFEASKISINQIYSIISGSLNGIKNILVGAISTCNLQGPIGIASTTGEAAQQGMATFIWIIALLSTAIGMLNLFPIPMFDGGHLLFFGIEAVTRKKPTEKLIKGMNFLGLFILVMLMLTAISSDLICP